ncbi:MAG: hypothetical protein V4671_28760, partial [Armatimonadota bacterium]
SFLTTVAEEMALGAGNEDIRSLPSIPLSSLAEADVPPVLSYPTLCALTDTLVTKRGIAQALCAHLRAAESAEARGKAAAEAGALRAYRNLLAAQAGKSLTPADSTTLAQLSRTL